MLGAQRPQGPSAPSLMRERAKPLAEPTQTVQAMSFRMRKQLSPKRARLRAPPNLAHKKASAQACGRPRRSFLPMITGSQTLPRRTTGRGQMTSLMISRRRTPPLLTTTQSNQPPSAARTRLMRSLSLLQHPLRPLRPHQPATVTKTTTTTSTGMISKTKTGYKTIFGITISTITMTTTHISITTTTTATRAPGLLTKLLLMTIL